MSLSKALESGTATKAGSARAAIDDILKVGATHVSMATLFSLMELEARPVPADVSIGQIELKDKPKLCCFDASSPSLPSWTAHAVCARCQQLNLLVRGEQWGWSLC